MKRIISVIFVIAIVAMAAIPAFAANESVITPVEKELLDYMSQTRDLKPGTTFKFREVDINALRNFLKTVDVTEAQKEYIKSEVDAAYEVYRQDPNAGQDLNDLSYATKKALLNHLNNILKLFGMYAKFDFATKTLLYLKNDGTLVYEGKVLLDIVKQTGADYTTIAIAGISSLLVLGVAAGGIFFKKGKTVRA